MFSSAALSAVGIALAMVTPGAALAQITWPPKPQTAPHYAGPPPLPETWEDLPLTLRLRLEKTLAKPASTQSRLIVAKAATPDSQPRALEAGDLVVVQAASPAPGVILSQASDPRGKYGASGDVLWPIIDATGEYYCHRAGVRTGGSSRLYCFREADGDGRFEIVKLAQPGLSPSADETKFQVAYLGTDQKLDTPVPYQRGAAALYVDLIGLRYDGAVRGRIIDDKVVDGAAMFHVVGGESADHMSPGRQLIVALDGQGRGTLDDGAYRLEIHDVTVDGAAQIRLRQALPEGPALSDPPPTREMMVEAVRRAMGGD
ncbi:MAG TPA: hypothetical protein VN157_03780 [Caulobacter sp.]|nr:hypothetical protein [Caulobacter sp.]